MVVSTGVDLGKSRSNGCGIVGVLLVGIDRVVLEL